jgi:autotransporter-associated beta strand protein
MRRYAASLLICGLAVFTSTTTEAATRTWKTVPVDTFWSNPANWQEGVAPVNGDDLVFPQTPGPNAMVNTTANIEVRSIRFIGEHTVSGQPFSIGEGGIAWGGSGNQSGMTVAVPVTLLVNQTWNLHNVLGLTFSAGLALNGRTLTLEGPVPSGTVRSTGVVSGSGTLIVNSGGLSLENANTYAGQTIINAGTVNVGHADALGIGDGTIANGTLVNGIGRLQMTSATVGNERIRITGGHVGRISGSGTFTGPVELAGNARAGAVFGTLGFSGPFEVIGSQLASIPTLQFDFENLDFNGAVLSLTLPEAFHPTVGQTFTLVEKLGLTPVVGTFTGLPEGASITSRGVTFTISYIGGAGNNDVVLTVTSIVQQYYLSEGATGTFFSTDILLANPNTTAAPVTVTFLKSDGTSVVQSQNLPAQSRRTIRVNDVDGMEGVSFSTIVRSDDALPIVVERTMRWDATGYGSHTERAVDGPSNVWYFAEGSQGFFFTYVLLTNPQTTANSATVQYLFEGEPTITRTYPIEASSRYTVDIGADEALRDKSFGMTVTFDQPGTAERAMYFGTSPLWKGGHESVGVTAPSTSWFLAEGATGTFFETFVLLANPNAAAVQATLTFLPATGQPVTKEKTIPANGRVTVNIEQEDASLASVAVATTVTASLPIIVERSQYWPDPAPAWYEAHNSFGVTSAGTKWGLAEGRVGGDDAAQTYILLANPGFVAAEVEITFLRENGAPVTKSFTVEPRTRFNVAVGSASVPEITNERFGAVIESDTPIIVERALYWDAANLTWAAGSNATATRLP